jgi:hypothetical protein
MSGQVTRESLGSDWNAVLARRAQGGPINTSAEHGWAALGALERSRREHLARYHDTQALGNLELSQLLAHASDLLACEQLKGLASILDRLDHGERGAMVELEVLAFVARCGLVPVIEPELHGKQLDFAVDVAGERIFAEVIGPERSESAESLIRELQQAASGLFDCVGPD